MTACGIQKNQQNISFPVVNSQAVTQTTQQKGRIDQIKQTQNDNYNIRIASPDLGKPITSPLKITGQASGLFFNEGVFQISLKDAAGTQLAKISARAIGDWMTQDMVAFVAELPFEQVKTQGGALVFEGANGTEGAVKIKEINVIFDKSVLAPQTQAFSSQQLYAELDKKTLARLRSGCLAGKDCIPSIDKPKLLSAKKAAFLKNDDLVMGLVVGKEARAYPVKILNWHEIVNDSIQNKPVVATYCPLCATGRVFERVLDGETLEFGVSGMLLNSNMVMYDRKINTLWSQFSGEGLVGPKRGTKLKQLQVDMILWKDWLKKYPNTMVLSKDTGYRRDYEKYPYGDYQKNSEVYFPLENENKSRFAKEIVYGIVIGDKQKIYPESELQKVLPNGGEIQDDFAGRKLKITYDKGVFRVREIKSAEDVLNTVSFYFSWIAFYPNSEVFKAK